MRIAQAARSRSRCRMRSHFRTAHGSTCAWPARPIRSRSRSHADHQPGGRGVHSALALTRLGDAAQLVSDGGNWLVDAYPPPLFNEVGIITIADQLTAPPVSPTPGARCIISGAPTGVWSPAHRHDRQRLLKRELCRYRHPQESNARFAYVAMLLKRRGVPDHVRRTMVSLHPAPHPTIRSTQSSSFALTLSANRSSIARTP